MKRLGIITALLTLLMAVSAGVALAAVSPGTYGPDPGSFNPANAPGSSHLVSGSPSCTVNTDRSIDCTGYVLGGVGHTNATVSLTANYSATINCTNHGGNLVETHTATFQADSPPPDSTSPFSAPQVCPNPNWTPSIAPGTLVLNSFSYTLTFEGFGSAYITISGLNPI